MATWLVILISLAAAASIGVTIVVVVVRGPHRMLADAAQTFEGQKKEVGAEIAADLERMRVALASAPHAPAAAEEALARAREQTGAAAEHAANAAAADGRTHSTEVTACTMALAAAARELAAAEASAAGQPPPEPSPPCVLDPAHGASSTTVTWTPSGGLPRPVPVCAADAARISSGMRPEVRMVVTEGSLVPYFDVPYAQYVPWLLGYYAGFDPYITARLLAGTRVGAHLPGHIRARHGVASDPVGEFGRPGS